MSSSPRRGLPSSSGARRPLRLTTAERRARLAGRHHLAPAARAASVGAAAYSLVGLHSTDPASVYLAAWARVDGLRHADVDSALYDERTIVKHLAMRRTVWAVATGLLPVVQAAASDDVAATERRKIVRDVERGGLAPAGERWLSETEATVVAALAELGPTAGRDLTRSVPQLQAKMRTGPGGRAEYGVVSRVTAMMSAAGVITRARAGGAWQNRQPRWVLMRDWCPEVVAEPPPESRVARAALLGHWLRAFGPATPEDVTWWTGWTVARTKTALGDVGVVEVRLEGDEVGVALPDDLEPVAPVEPWVALLPSLDPSTMGWSRREWYLGPHRDRLFDSYGNAGPTVWSDGRVVGGWGQRPGGEVVVRLLEDIGAEQAAAVEVEAERLTAWLAGVQVRPTFPTPLQRELSG